AVRSIGERAAEIHHLRIALWRNNKIVVPALACAVAFSLPGWNLRRGEIGEDRRASLDEIAAVETRRRRPSVTYADVHARVAARQLGNCELCAIGVIRTIQRRLDLRPGRAAVGRAPNALLECGRVKRGVRRPVVVRVELNVIDPADRTVAVPNEAERRAAVR